MELSCLRFGKRIVQECLKCQKRTFIHRWSKFLRWQEIEAEEKEEKKVEKSIKNYIKLADGAYISPERVEDGKGCGSFLLIHSRNYLLLLCGKKFFCLSRIRDLVEAKLKCHMPKTRNLRIHLGKVCMVPEFCFFLCILLTRMAFPTVSLTLKVSLLSWQAGNEALTREENCNFRNRAS